MFEVAIKIDILPQEVGGQYLGRVCSLGTSWQRRVSSTLTAPEQPLS